MPTPLISRISEVRVDSTPIFLKAFKVERVSSPLKKPFIVDKPSARELKITDLCEMDLSPGGVITPIKGPEIPLIVIFATENLDYHITLR
jgi:hypothetical protein